MMKLTREVKTGIIVLLTFGILVWGINFLKGRDIFFTGDKYYGIYNRVDGLTDASPVYYKGFKVGLVRNIEIHPADQNKFLVTFAITKKVSFPKNTVAEIYSLDLMGSKGVQFIPNGNSGKLMAGDTLPCSVMGDFVDQMSIQVLPLKEKTEKLIVKLDSTLTKMDAFFSESNQQHFNSAMSSLDASLANINQITASVNQQLGEGGNLNNSLKRLDVLTASLAGKSHQIARSLDNLAVVTDQLKAANLDSTLADLNKSLSQASKMLADINKGEGSVGLLLKDEQLYNRMADAAENMDRLLVDVKERPSRYVHFSLVDFGGDEKTRQSARGTQGVVFQVLLEESKKALGMAGKEIEPGLRIYEDYDGTKYYYVVGLYRQYDEANGLLARCKELYPRAEVIALENGEPMRLGKAVRKDQ
jgi:phospholipid/cholesterol/gamma-HCH transport system substrate-binding protein